MLRSRHDEQRLKFVIKLVVNRRHLKFILEVGDGAQALDDGSRPHLMREIDEQPIERLDANILEPASRFPHEFHTLVKGEQRLFLR